MISYILIPIAFIMGYLIGYYRMKKRWGRVKQDNETRIKPPPSIKHRSHDWDNECR